MSELIEYWKCAGCTITGTAEEVDKHILDDAYPGGVLLPIEQIVCWGSTKVVDYTEVRPGSNYDPNNLTVSQRAELDRRKEVDEALMSDVAEAERYIEDCRTRRHLSWY